MGLDEPALYDSDETMARQVLDSGHPSLAGITLEALKERGWMRLNYPDPFVPFANGFPTPSGKLEFVSERMASAGLDPVAGYTAAYEASQRETSLARAYPLALVTPANHYFLNSIFANVPGQQRRSGRPAVLIHPDDAQRRGASRKATQVRVGNARGAFVAVADDHAIAFARVSSPARRAAGRVSPAARTSTRPSTSATPTWAAAPCSTTTASRSKRLDRWSGITCPAGIEFRTVPTILVIDEEPNELSFLEQALKDGGYTLRAAKSIADGRAAIESALTPGGADDLDAIILDWQTRDAEAVELLRWLEALPRSERLEIIVQSSGSAPDQLRPALDRGMFVAPRQALRGRSSCAAWWAPRWPARSAGARCSS